MEALLSISVIGGESPTGPVCVIIRLDSFSFSSVFFPRPAFAAAAQASLL